MPLGKSQSLITGSLKLIYPDGQVIDYLATSGLPDFQRPDRSMGARERAPFRKAITKYRLSLIG
jgi:hypothetical protein